MAGEAAPIHSEIRHAGDLLEKSSGGSELTCGELDAHDSESLNAVEPDILRLRSSPARAGVFDRSAKCALLRRACAGERATCKPARLRHAECKTSRTQGRATQRVQTRSV